jgi:hypothetical protein
VWGVGGGGKEMRSSCFSINIDVLIKIKMSATIFFRFIPRLFILTFQCCGFGFKGFDDQKCNLLTLGLMKDLQATRETQALKRENPALPSMKEGILIFCVTF